MTEVARRLGCSSNTVARRLREHGIAPRHRGPVPVRRTVAATTDGWSAELAWAVGLIATDGNLGRKRAAISIVSKDSDLLESIRRCLRLTTPIRPHAGGYGTTCHHLVWRDRAFYEWLLMIGLTPAKSLTLGPLAIPDEFFADFFRGCIDGDGSITVYTDCSNVSKSDEYVYERLYVSIVSASPRFIEWLQTTVARLTGSTGSITVRHGPRLNPIWKLRFSKAQSIRLLRWMYYAPDVQCLNRKRRKAEKFLTSLGCSAKRPKGRPRVGWLYRDREVPVPIR